MKSNGKNNRKNDIPLNVQKAKQEQTAEQAAEKQALYVDFWESMTENEYIETVKMINTNQFDINSKLFKDKDLLEFVKMKIKQGNEQADQESKTFFELLPQMSEQVQLSMIRFINDHFTDEQTHLDYVSLVKMARERAVEEQKHFELIQKNKELNQKKFDDFWFEIHQPDKIKNLEMILKAIESKVIDNNMLNYLTKTVGLGLDDFLTMWEVKQAKQAELKINLHKWAEKKEEQAEQDEQELERLEKVGDLIEENLRNEELEEEETDKLEKEFFKGYAQETEIEEVTEVANEILTQNLKTEMKTQEVVNENTSVNNTQTIVNQQVTNNTLNVTLETPKPKMSIAEKIVEAQKMLTIAEKKETIEIRLKEFYGYLHGNRDGDNFRLMSSDEKYKFSTNNIELVKEVNVVLERFFKNKIQEFETELANFQI